MIYRFMFIIVASQRCLFEALCKFITLLVKIYRGNPVLLSRTTINKKFVSFNVWRDMGGKTEFFDFNVEILLHHHLICFMMNESEKLMKRSVNEDDFIFPTMLCCWWQKRKQSNGWNRTVNYLDGCFPPMDCRMGLLTPAVLLVISLNLWLYITR